MGKSFEHQRLDQVCDVTCLSVSFGNPALVSLDFCHCWFVVFDAVVVVVGNVVAIAVVAVAAVAAVADCTTVDTLFAFVVDDFVAVVILVVVLLLFLLLLVVLSQPFETSSIGP